MNNSATTIAPIVTQTGVTGISKIDRGIVGFTESGKTTPWGYKNGIGAVNPFEARSIGDYPVNEIPCTFTGLDGQIYATDKKAIFRSDTNTLLSTVGKDYQVLDNSLLSDFVEQSVLAPFPQINIESVGTMEGGRTYFYSLLIDNFNIKGDESENETRLAFFFDYGKFAVKSFITTHRIECANTARVAIAQGKANDTLSRIKHTKNAQERFEAKAIELTEIIEQTQKHNRTLETLATQEINTKFLNNTLEFLFPSKNELGENFEGAKYTKSINKQNKIIELFETKDDLQHLADTRYKLFQAITDYTSHGMSLKKTANDGDRLINAIDPTKVGDKLAQKAFQFIVKAPVFA